MTKRKRSRRIPKEPECCFCEGKQGVRLVNGKHVCPECQDLVEMIGLEAEEEVS